VFLQRLLVLFLWHPWQNEGKSHFGTFGVQHRRVHSLVTSAHNKIRYQDLRPLTARPNSRLRFMRGWQVSSWGGLLGDRGFPSGCGTGWGPHWLLLDQLGLVLAGMGRVHQDPVYDAKVLCLNGAHVAVPLHHTLWQEDQQCLHGEHGTTPNCSTEIFHS